ncbi:MAG: CAP domain-containing protein [Microgenomates group bacterium]
MSNWILYAVLLFIIGYLSFPQYRDRLNLPTTRPPQSISPTGQSSLGDAEQVIVPKEKITYQKTSDEGQWGVAKKIGEHTYTIKVGEDARMATSQEIVDALNAYRKTQGVGELTIDSKLTEYAQSRADFFKSQKTTDAHAGFSNYLDNEDGFTKLGFTKLGENSYYGGPLYGVHLIEWVFGASPEHNANQLDGSWNYVGVGVNNTAVNLIFGGGKM